MLLKRFDGDFHQSDLKTYSKCPYSFYLSRVLDVDRERINMSTMGGTAGHAALEYAHLQNHWDGDTLCILFDNFMMKLIEWNAQKGMEITGKINEEEYHQMIRTYASKPYNQLAEVIAIEKEFIFAIKPAKTVYSFTGRIDQLVRVPLTAYLPEFPWLKDAMTRRLGQEPPEDFKLLLHRDLKFGQRRECSKFELSLDIQFDTYGYALYYGYWKEDDNFEKTIGLIPEYHIKYHLSDYIPYKDDSGTFLKDPVTGGRVRCDIVDTPCLVGVRQKPCEGKRKSCTKQMRGPAQYFTRRPLARLESLPGELGKYCASIRMGYYQRSLNQLCSSYCQYRKNCEFEVLQEIYQDEIVPPSTAEDEASQPSSFEGE